MTAEEIDYSLTPYLSSIFHAPFIPSLLVFSSIQKLDEMSFKTLKCVKKKKNFPHKALIAHELGLPENQE